MAGQYGWLSFFIFLCAWVVFISFRSAEESSLLAVSGGERKKDASESGMDQDYFKNIHYYYFLWGKDEKNFHLRADELRNNVKTQRTVFVNPAGNVNLKGNRSLSYRGKRGHFEGDREKLYLEDDVFFSDENSNIGCSRAVYATGKKELRLAGNVIGVTRFRDGQSSIRVRSAEALARPVSGYIGYSGGVEGELKSSKTQGEELSFAAETLDMYLHRQHLDILENVIFRRIRLEARGNRGEIFWNAKNENIKYYVLYDNVRLREKVFNRDGNGFFERSALAEKLEGALDDNRVVLSGRPRVVQLEDIIKGNRIILKKDSEIVEVDDASANFRLR